MNIIPLNKQRRFCSKIKRHCVVTCSSGLEDLSLIGFNGDIEKTKTFLLNNKDNIYILKGGNYKILDVLEKDNVLFFAFFIKITDLELKKKVVKRLKDLDMVMGAEFSDNIDYRDEDDYFIKFRMSVNSSFERANMGFVEKELGISYIGLLNFYSE